MAGSAVVEVFVGETTFKPVIRQVASWPAKSHRARTQESRGNGDRKTFASVFTVIGASVFFTWFLLEQVIVFTIRFAIRINMTFSVPVKMTERRAVIRRLDANISLIEVILLAMTNMAFRSKFGFEASSQWKLLHWGTGRYLMNRIQVVHFKLKEIWSLFSIAKAKKMGSFFFFWMKANLSQNLALKLAPNGNYFTEELVGILWIEFKLYISNWKRFDLYLPLLKTKNRARFLFPFCQTFEWKHKISVQIWPWTIWIQFIRYLPVPQWSSSHWKITSRSYQSLNVWCGMYVY